MPHRRSPSGSAKPLSTPLPWLAAAALAAALPAPAEASGSFPPTPPRAPGAGGTRSVNNPQYAEGRALFTRDTRVDPANPPDLTEAEFLEQDEGLALLMERLPRRAVLDNDLTELAGLLTMNQYRALLYYIQVRFKVKLERNR